MEENLHCAIHVLRIFGGGFNKEVVKGSTSAISGEERLMDVDLLFLGLGSESESASFFLIEIMLLSEVTEEVKICEGLTFWESFFLLLFF